MRNSKNKEKVVKQKLAKCSDQVCRTYSQLQTVYAEILEKDDRVQCFACNVSLPDFPLKDGSYTTDFLVTLTDGELVVAECCPRDHICRPKTISLLDASREYWLRRGVKPENWRLVVNEEK